MFLWWLQEPEWEAPGHITGWKALALVPLGTEESVPSYDFPNK
jgi:hypothetical protein